MRKTVLALGVAFAVYSLPSCQNKESEQEQQEVHATQKHTAGADSASAVPVQQLAYICPMECEGSASEAPGKCPVCGMDLVKNPKAAASLDSTALQ